jgi:hypothetical protein
VIAHPAASDLVFAETAHDLAGVQSMLDAPSPAGGAERRFGVERDAVLADE